MAFYSPRLPLRRDSKNGYILLDNLKDVIKQNFKMIILTMPGERIMDPDFGVGLYQFLFELAPPYSDVEEKIYARVINQTRVYLPSISIKDISFAYEESSNPLQENNTLYVRVEYFIKALNANDVLEVSINSNF